MRMINNDVWIRLAEGRRQTLGRSRVMGRNLVVKLSANRTAWSGTWASSSGSSESLAAAAAALFFCAPIPLYLINLLPRACAQKMTVVEQSLGGF